MNLFHWFALGFVASTCISTLAAEPTTKANIPETLQTDDKLSFTFGDETLVLPDGLQPSMFVTATGAIVVQAQVHEKPAPSTRMKYPYDMRMVISRDGEKDWKPIPRDAFGPLNLEGGGLQLRGGAIVALDTYVTPGASANQGMGLLFTSTDDMRTLEGPKEVPFDLPNIDFYGSSDDGGHPHAAARLHRRIIELPNGDLLATMYGLIQGDHTPCPYQPKMMKSRSMLVRSSDRGLHWKLVSTIAVDPKVGTEGFGEPVICRISKGPNAGRLICFMRTGRELFEATSDDEGATWSKPAPRVFADLDIYRTEKWIEQFSKFKGMDGKPLSESPDDLPGAVVDPDLIELRSAFGVRIPQKLCWRDPTHPWNGNYLAFSTDHGKTWPTVVRMTSGVLTTHYMAIEELPKDNRLFVAYDLGGWSKGMNRDVYGRTLEISLKRF
ncbi:MAG TPA: sialidase family protein [Tepidisphaeraceae bacterium]|jgi:hypothetical protein|nr:sialidase family protein [Tepidisphaeraceae bacterium]